MAPDVGYYVLDVLVDGASVGAASSYTFANITSDHTIDVSFELDTFTVTSTAGLGGSISPLGATVVSYGDSLAFTMTPDVGYHVLDVLVDGASVGAVTSYTFTNITANHTIDVSFELETFTVTSSAGPGGAITPSGVIQVSYGGSVTFTMAPASGYGVLDVLVDGVSVGPVMSYTFTNIAMDHTIQVSFALETYTIVASAGAGGSIAPAGSVVVAHGDSASFTMTPDVGFEISDVLVDGSSVGPLSTYTFSNVTEDHTIECTFAVATYTITASAGAGGTIDPEGITVVSHGDSLTVTVTPDSTFEVADVLVDGVSVGALTSYTFENVVADRDIQASFTLQTYEISISAGPGGSTDPEGVVSVAHGDSLAIAITPDPGFHILDVLVDDISVGAVSSYTFVDVSEDHSVQAMFESDATGVGTETVVGPTQLLRGGPNPFRHSTRIVFQVAQPELVELAIFAVDGRLVRILDKKLWPVGRHVLTWDGRDDHGVSVSSGTYFVRFRTTEKREVTKVTVIR
jgi:hypothetical protein